MENFELVQFKLSDIKAGKYRACMWSGSISLL